MQTSHTGYNSSDGLQFQVYNSDMYIGTYENTQLRFFVGDGDDRGLVLKTDRAVSYTHLTLPTNREV